MSEYYGTSTGYYQTKKKCMMGGCKWMNSKN
jgi:hypothetical protein